MKKILIAAALVASTAMPATAVYAADAPAASTPKPVCFILPLMPDCLSAWKADTNAFMHKMTPAPKAAAKTAAVVVPAAPKLPAMPSCTKAAAGAGHLFDCK